MKKSTGEKKLAAMNVSKNSNAYKLVIAALNGETLLRPCHTSGSGRFTTNIDCTIDLTDLLTKMGISYEKGNDSPRGGKTGNFVKITTKIHE